MSEKSLKNTIVTEELGFDHRDLDQSVVQRLQAQADKEAQMIANFNAKVNSEEHHQALKSAQQAEDISETGGPQGLEPTRYGDWERKGRCYDF